MATYVSGSVRRGSSIWRSQFDRLSSGLTHSWKLRTVKQLPSIEEDRNDGWKRYQGKGKVQFKCKKCRNTWSSLYGTVIFHYRLNTNESQGEVKMQPMGQKCRDCSADNFEEAEWYRSEISEVLSNLLAKVKVKYYDCRPKSRNPPPSDRRKMNGPHRRDLCEACEKGVCAEKY